MEGEFILTTETNNKVLTREEVEEHLTWRLEDIFPSNDAWEKEFQEVAELS